MPGRLLNLFRTVPTFLGEDFLELEWDRFVLVNF